MIIICLLSLLSDGIISVESVCVAEGPKMRSLGLRDRNQIVIYGI